jgi:putative transposase
MLDWNDRESVREYIKQNNIKDMIQLNTSVKKMMGAMIEEMLEVERDDHLGYSKHERKKDTENLNGNLRNGYSPKTVRSSQGDIKLDIPRDRDGYFEPALIKKHQNDISQIEDKIISMYAGAGKRYDSARYPISSRNIRMTSHIEEI